LVRYGFWRIDYFTGFRQISDKAYVTKSGNNHTDVKVNIPVHMIETTTTN